LAAKRPLPRKSERAETPDREEQGEQQAKIGSNTLHY
jgi:hypothetical protein